MATDGAAGEDKPRGRVAARAENNRGYFRRVYQENPAWLRERSNAKVVRRWLADHAGHAEMPRNVKSTLNNLKSHLRQPAQDRAAADPKTKPLDQLELLLDQSLALARALDPEGLRGVIRLLRRARKEVIRRADP